MAYQWSGAECPSHCHPTSMSQMPHRDAIRPFSQFTSSSSCAFWQVHASAGAAAFTVAVCESSESSMQRRTNKVLHLHNLMHLYMTWMFHVEFLALDFAIETLDYCLEDCTVLMPKIALLTSKNWSQIVLWLNLNQNWKNSIVDRQLPDPHSNVRDRRCLIIDQFWENFKPSPDNEKRVHQHLMWTWEILELISAFSHQMWGQKT